MGRPMVACPFGHWLPCTGCLHLLCVWYGKCWGYCFYIYPLPWMFLPTDILFWTTDLIIYNSLLNIMLTTCLLYDGQLLGLCFLKWQLVCNFGTVERILFISNQFLVFVCLHIIQVLYVIFPLSLFQLWNNFFFIFILSTLYHHIP